MADLLSSNTSSPALHVNWQPVFETEEENGFHFSHHIFKQPLGNHLPSSGEKENLAHFSSNIWLFVATLSLLKKMKSYYPCLLVQPQWITSVEVYKYLKINYLPLLGDETVCQRNGFMLLILKCHEKIMKFSWKNNKDNLLHRQEANVNHLVSGDLWETPINWI